LGEIYGEGDPVAAGSFKKVLDAERPDIVHFHAWSPAVSILLVREVKRRGLRLVQTYHTPTLSCPRGTLMRWGKIVCDGDLARRPCVACCIQGKAEKVWRKKIIHGIPDTGCRIQGESQHRNSPNPESRIPNPNIQGIRMLVSKLTTMFRMPGLIRKRTEAVREMFRAVDAMVALNDWSRKLLVLNGVKESKIRLILHGIPAPSAGVIGDRGEGSEEASISSRKDPKDAKGVGQTPETGYRIRDAGLKMQDDGGWRKEAGTALKLVFLGRVAPEKGIDVLLRAMEMVKIPVELDIYGIRAEGGSAKDIGYGISDIGNAQVRWLAPVKPEEVVETIRKYDALVVPSVWLETGPLVVLEAFAAGVPVIGSRLGGIAEMVRDGVDGLLFEVGKPEDLADKIQEFHRRMKNIKAGVPRVKNTREVGYEHLKLYQQLLSK
jgi:glycosyltransferase involved in cell wall biosynthesis